MGKTILIIEDEAALQKTFEDALSKEGFEVLHALDGEIGIQIAQEKHPDLIMLDLVLPRKDGFQVLEALKKAEQTKNIPVIVLTNREELDDIQRAIDLGATTYLIKSSYRLDEIIKKVKEGLDGSAEQ